MCKELGSNKGKCIVEKAGEREKKVNKKNTIGGAKSTSYTWINKAQNREGQVHGSSKKKYSKSKYTHKKVHSNSTKKKYSKGLLDQVPFYPRVTLQQNSKKKSREGKIDLSRS